MTRKHVLRKKAQRIWLRRVKSKKKRKEKRKSLIGAKREDRKTRNTLRQNWDITKVIAPKKFSFVGHTNEVVKFINELSRCYDKNRKVFVVLKNIDELTYDAVVVLLSIMVKFKAKKIGFNGDVPKNKKALDLLAFSGFFHYLYVDGFKISDSYNLPTKNLIYTHAKKTVDSVLGSKIISSASKTIWGKVRRCQGVQKTFMELMLNTNNHADIEMEGVKHWWLSVFHVPEENKVTFSFVDFGVGVFNSLDNKTDRSKWYGWTQKLAQFFSFSNNADILKLILDGHLHTTVTKEPYRGNGLPGLKLALSRNQISNLHIITNNVKADVKNDTYETITNSFNGTFVYWELNKNNVSCDGNA